MVGMSGVGGSWSIMSLCGVSCCIKEHAPWAKDMESRAWDFAVMMIG